MPDLTGGVGVLAQDSQAFADVGEVGVGVGLVRIAQDAGGLAGQGGRDDPVAEDGPGAAAGPKSSEARPMATWTRPAWWAARSSRAMPARSVPFLVSAA